MIDHTPIFRDRALNESLFTEGYITLPFLNKKEVDALIDLFWKNHSEEEVVGGLYVTSHIKDNASIHSISDGIQAIFKRSINEHIENGLSLGGTFICKSPNQIDPLQPHQDWSIVDESRFRSFTIWVALEDVNDENGCMYVLPRSHEYVRGYRHITIPSVFGLIYDTIWKYMKPIHLKAGEAIVFDHALGHASKPNTTGHVRIAATHSLISPNPEMRFYWNHNGVVEEYVGEKEYYMTEEAKSGPGNLTKIRDVDFVMHQLNEEEFYTLAGVEVPRPILTPIKERGILSWFQRLFR
jgi:hypothetical protein